MNKDIKKMSQDIQNRIRDMAYLMWESAGRQQGMAMEYWLAAEKEVMTTAQKAAERMIPAEKKASTSPAKPKAAPAKAAPAKPAAKPAEPAKTAATRPTANPPAGKTTTQRKSTS